MVTSAEKNYLARDELVDPTFWADQLQEEEQKKLAQQVWEAYLQTEVAQLVDELFSGKLWPNGSDFLEATTEYCRRINQVLGEWRKRRAAFRYSGDYVYWIQPRFRRVADSLGPGPYDFRIMRLTLVSFVAFAVDNRKLLFKRDWYQNLRLKLARWWKSL